jgi:hypothetical protein
MEDTQIIVLINNRVLIARVSAVVSDLGEPDCKLIKPYEIIDGKLNKWLSDFTYNEESIMISSDKILTLVDPKESLLNDYLTLTQ